MFVSRKEPGGFFIPNKFLSIVIHRSKQKEDLSTQMNKTKIKLLCFSDTAPPNSRQEIITFWFPPTAGDMKSECENNNNNHHQTPEKYSYLHGFL